MASRCCEGRRDHLGISMTERKCAPAGKECGFGHGELVGIVGNESTAASSRNRGRDRDRDAARRFFAGVPSARMLLLGLTVLLLGAPSTATAVDPRPCGPARMTSPLKFLIPQGIAGADFRPACRRHDACYDTAGANRHACDRQFQRDLIAACDRSRCPLFCRFVAVVMGNVTMRYGEQSFQTAQAIAGTR